MRWSPTELPRIEIYGTDGTLSVPDPNTFDGPVRLKKKGEKTWQDVPLTHAYSGYDRGLGVADMAYALRSGRPHRASGSLAYHVLDTLQVHSRRFGRATFYRGGKHLRASRAATAWTERRRTR